MIKLEMKNYSTILIEKQLKYLLIIRQIHKYEYLTSVDILPSNHQQIIGQAKITYSTLEKAFDKQIKTIEDQGKKQIDALNTLKCDNNEKLEIKDENVIRKSVFGNDEAKKEFNKIKNNRRKYRQRKISL